MRYISCILCVLCLCSAWSRSLNSEYPYEEYFNEKNPDHWRIQAQWLLYKKLENPLNTKIAKNVIMFLGDGMSISTLAATRVYMAKGHSYSGEELKLFFEDFPYTGLAKTYCVDSNVADSACSGTAYLTGVKANYGTLGVSGQTERGRCGVRGAGVDAVNGLIAWAQRAGKRTGVVTTTRVTHATPAATYAHSAERRWEADADIPQEEKFCEDIASQLVRGEVGSKIDVVLGGGRRNFHSTNQLDTDNNPGRREDGANLIEEWLMKKRIFGSEARYVENRTEFLDLDVEKYNSILGLFSEDHLPYHLEANSVKDPTLSEMTQKAVEILSHRNDKGFFLFVEGGRIDTAHHESKAMKALDETAELAKAVETAVRMVNLEETLVVVTSDHSHTMTYNGYSRRGSNILGLANKMNSSSGLPYSILSYATGPGHRTDTDHDFRLDDMGDLNYTYPSLFPMVRETHGGEDVAVFAAGPWAHLFTGNYEQNYIPHAIAYASCIGSGLKACGT